MTRDHGSKQPFRRTYTKTRLREIPANQDVGIGRQTANGREKSWHLLTDDWVPLCPRATGSDLAMIAAYGALADPKICRMCWTTFSHELMPHDWEEQDCGYETPCWVWTRGAGGLGLEYGWRHSPVHRQAYESAYGPIPAGFVIHHRCETKRCVRPDHLEAMSRADHARLHFAGRRWGRHA